jgi:hypothetical protein
MSNRIRRAVFLYLISSAFLLLSHATTAQTPAATAQLKIDGSVATPLTLTVADLKAMPRKTLRVTNPHDKKVEVYEGVALEDLLRKAGVPSGEQLRGPLMASYVIAEADDIRKHPLCPRGRQRLIAKRSGNREFSQAYLALPDGCV